MAHIIPNVGKYSSTMGTPGIYMDLLSLLPKREMWKKLLGGVPRPLDVRGATALQPSGQCLRGYGGIAMSTIEGAPRLDGD